MGVSRGKVEAAESPETALARELSEELGIEIDPLRALPRFLHDYGPVVIEMFPFVCRLAKGSRPPHAHEHIALQWVAPTGLAALDLAPADFPVVASYRATA